MTKHVIHHNNALNIWTFTEQTHVNGTQDISEMDTLRLHIKLIFELKIAQL